MVLRTKIHLESSTVWTKSPFFLYTSFPLSTTTSYSCLSFCNHSKKHKRMDNQQIIQLFKMKILGIMLFFSLQKCLGSGAYWSKVLDALALKFTPRAFLKVHFFAFPNVQPVHFIKVYVFYISHIFKLTISS